MHRSAEVTLPCRSLPPPSCLVVAHTWWASIPLLDLKNIKRTYMFRTKANTAHRRSTRWETMHNNLIVLQMNGTRTPPPNIRTPLKTRTLNTRSKGEGVRILANRSYKTWRANENVKPPPPPHTHTHTLHLSPTPPPTNTTRWSHTTTNMQMRYIIITERQYVATGVALCWSEHWVVRLTGWCQE